MENDKAIVLTKGMKIDRSASAIYERRVAIYKIMELMRDKNGAIDTMELLKEVQTKGYGIHKTTLYEDMTAINKANTFVFDIATSNYSAMIQECFEGLQQCVRQCNEIYNTKWTNNKIIRKTITTADGETVIEEEVITKELAGPKAKATDIKSKCYKYMFDALKGDIINTASSLMLREFQKLKALKEELEEDLEKEKAKNKELMLNAQINR